MTTDRRVGTIVGAYRLESIIGRGGMSVVYLGEHTTLGRRAAVKVIADELAADDSFADRFVRESQIVASFDHANVIPIYDAGRSGSDLYIAMRYVDGTDLRGLITRSGRLDVGLAVDVLTQVARALDAAHKHGLVHRDVKPANVLIGQDGRVYLADFGLAKAVSAQALTRTGGFLGTLHYAAPEQIEGAKVDARTDVYSLGCVLFEMLTGAPPFRRDSDLAVIHAHLNDLPPVASSARADLPPELDDVIARALSKAPADRYQTPIALADAAARAVRSEPAPYPFERAAETAEDERATVVTGSRLPVLVCPACGDLEEPGAKFCGSCGASLPSQSVGPPAATTAPPATAPSLTRPTDPSPATRRSRKGATIAAALAVLVAASAAAGYVASGRKSHTAASASSTPTTTTTAAVTPTAPTTTAAQTPPAQTALPLADYPPTETQIAAEIESIIRFSHVGRTAVRQGRYAAAVANRRAVLVRLRALDGATGNLALAQATLERAIQASLESDISYLNGTDATTSDKRATAAKRLFLAQFTPLAVSLGLPVLEERDL